MTVSQLGPRIGHGIDVHRFGDGDTIVLGGVRIAHNQGLVAHSDGDVVLHAFSGCSFRRTSFR